MIMYLIRQAANTIVGVIGLGSLLGGAVGTGMIFVLIALISEHYTRSAHGGK